MESYWNSTRLHIDYQVNCNCSGTPPGFCLPDGLTGAGRGWRVVAICATHGGYPQCPLRPAPTASPTWRPTPPWLTTGLVEALERELAELREENAELRRQLQRHSGNSGQPPSQDGPAASRAMPGRLTGRWRRRRSMSVWTTGRRGVAAVARPCPGRMPRPWPGTRCMTCRRGRP